MCEDLMVFIRTESVTALSSLNREGKSEMTSCAEACEHQLQVVYAFSKRKHTVLHSLTRVAVNQNLPHQRELSTCETWVILYAAPFRSVLVWVYIHSKAVNLDLGFELWYSIKQVSNKSIIRCLEYWCLLVFIYCHDAFAILHPRKMLDRS